MCNAPDNGLQPLDDWHDIGIGPKVVSVRRGAGFRKSAAAHPLPSSKGTSVHYRQAITATIWSFVVTIIFGLGLVWPWKGNTATIDFFTAFLVEKSLSVDNLFVFLMIFEYFKVPEMHTQRVLKWGILSALVFRGIMIGLGVAVVTRFRPVLLVFALILVVSSYKMLQPENEAESLTDNPIMKLARRVVQAPQPPWSHAPPRSAPRGHARPRAPTQPRSATRPTRPRTQATDQYDGDKFFTREGGVRRATPMLVVRHLG